MPAIWTPPLTWAADQLVTAGHLNQQLRDNLDFLRTPPLTQFMGTLSGSTTSETFVDTHPSLKRTVTTQGGRVLVAVSGMPRNEFAGNNRADFRLFHNTLGTLTHVQVYFDIQYARGGVCLVALTPVLTAGAHEFRVQWLTAAGRTVGLWGVWAMFAMEI